MLPPSLTPLFLSMLGIGTLTTLMSSHWLLAWMGLEINSLAILPLMIQNQHPRAVEATIKYFLTQATAAAMLLFASATNAWLTGQWDIKEMTDPLIIVAITLALALKMGLAPMHSWLPEVLQGLDLITGLIISTWQKIAPFTLLIQIQGTYSPTLIILGILSTLVGGWGGLNQTQLRKILAYSSIAHLGWMMLVMQFSTYLAFMTLLIYLVMTFSMFLTCLLNSATTINMLATSWSKNPVLTVSTPLVLLSLGGLPPLTGFAPKWLILQELTKHDLGLLATTTALTALLSLFFYLRVTYAMAVTLFPLHLTSTAPWRFSNNQLTLPLATSTVATISLLPLTPAITALLTP
uniref:NADH-ubiquinone oxidoreductase chain 2 n=2 Tax=Sphyraena TaxID=13691 RepID=A0A0X8IIG9_9TELE|nr:NADH dehydrogenase subunit 2 [Sphyraena jello]AMD38535.1 NADH dehydrogenase subunit 2 [Sphyraena jello]